MIGFTAEEKIELVEQYLVLPYGRKGPWLKERDISRDTMGRWKKGYLYGDLARDLIPREVDGQSKIQAV